MSPYRVEYVTDYYSEERNTLGWPPLPIAPSVLAEICVTGGVPSAEETLACAAKALQQCGRRGYRKKAVPQLCTWQPFPWTANRIWVLLMQKYINYHSKHNL